MRLNFSSINITSNVTSYYCGNVPKAGMCNYTFPITILRQTHSGNYTVNVSIEWENPERGTSVNSTLLNITVLSRINLSVPTNSLATNVTHGTEKQIGIFIVNSTGNDPVESISFSAYNFSSDFTFNFTPLNIPSLGGEYPQGVKVNVTARFGTPPGVYAGWINVTSGNDGGKIINVTLEVPVSRTWTMSATYCERVESPEEGTACEIVVNNTGNMIINYSITPVTNSSGMFNYTWANRTNFTVENGTFITFAVLYNITNQTIKFYYANYTVDAIQSGSSPDYQILQIILNPFIKPNVEVFVYPSMTEQLESVWIYANVTDQSGAGIADGNVTATVRRPDGTNSTVIMFFYSGIHTGGTSRWRARYPNDPVQGSWGNTTKKGYYNVTVFAIDNQGKNNTVNTSYFIIYSKLSPFFMTTLSTYYSKIGVSKPVIFYKSIDFSEDILPKTNVTFTINNSNSTVYNSSYKYGNLTTDNEGYIRDEYGGYLLETRDLAGFPLGNYTATAYSVYFEPNVSAFVSDVSTYTFELVESAGTLANIFVYPVWYPVEGIVKFKIWVTNAIGTLTDPADMNLSVTMPITGNPFFSRAISDMTEISEGVYMYTHNLPSNPTTGVYDVRLDVLGKDGTRTSTFSAFRISLGGPYDVEINLTEREVYQSDYLDFIIIMKNMGDAPTENFVEYWITGVDNTTWAYDHFSILITGNTEATKINFLPIYSYQPLGQYVLNVKVTYDANNSLSASAAASFSVIQGAPPTPPGPPSPGGAAPEGGGMAAPSAPPKIEIIRYPQELGMELDSVKYPVVEVKNIGGSKLYNVTLRITGIPSPWIQDIMPKVIPEIPVGNNSIFTVTLKIPPTAEAKEYVGQIIADANVTKDEKTFSLTLFTTRAQLIRWEVDRLNKALQQFEVDVENARKAGKDVKDVTPYIDQIKEQIRLAEDYLGKKMYDESLSAVQSGWSILEKARYLLAQAPFIQILIETIFPPWLIALLVVLVIAIAILLFFVRRMKGVFDRIFRMQAPGGGGAAKPSVMVEKMKERENLGKEEMNIRKVMSLLERQYKEGLITENAYMSLKTRNEEKLAKIEQMKAAMK